MQGAHPERPAGLLIIRRSWVRAPPAPHISLAAETFGTPRLASGNTAVRGNKRGTPVPVRPVSGLADQDKGRGRPKCRGDRGQASGQPSTVSMVPAMPAARISARTIRPGQVWRNRHASQDAAVNGRRRPENASRAWRLDMQPSGCGAAMSLTTAAEYALMLTDPSPQHPRPPEPGKLSARERELVTLVAQGRTDAQLFISVRTVHTHLNRMADHPDRARRRPGRRHHRRVLRPDPDRPPQRRCPMTRPTRAGHQPRPDPARARARSQLSRPGAEASTQSPPGATEHSVMRGDLRGRSPRS